MSNTTENPGAAEKVVDEIDKFAELPDAPPKKTIKLSWTGKLAAAIVAAWVVVAFIGPWIAPFHEAEFILDDSFVPAGGCAEMLDELYDIEEWTPEAITKYCSDADVTLFLGSDYLGRDTFSRILWGARTTIGISFVATLFAYFMGITLGIGAAVSGGYIDMVLSRVNESILSLPSIMLGLIVVAALGSSIPILIATASVIYATSVFRIARALGQDIMVQDFVEAAHARGEGLWWIITREVLPNAAMPLLTDFGLRLVFVILFISSLSFLGLGVQPPTADWGSMVRENMAGLGYGSYASIWPAIAIGTLTISINLIVDDISAKSGGSLAKKMV
ncbi:MAG: ABC transporter permease [Rhodospirillales bacterium]|jgi:peptide/nickel transport system permease protein|nr:ABC transporter permease [Rhodospirillales bacterium]MBT4041391.1 ABC transporter permease [Rhodospirillales bacterium]MBT4626080.1 ABC transporter permease [Rhodospirillales bacterium]MBT5352729.1 ABC transporter permease [Rhodospirillales bacterium]MBT6109272.1 ABC transporter permease [Rhodospirillales bacterium]